MDVGPPSVDAQVDVAAAGPSAVEDYLKIYNERLDNEFQIYNAESKKLKAANVGETQVELIKTSLIFVLDESPTEMSFNPELIGVRFIQGLREYIIRTYPLNMNLVENDYNFTNVSTEVIYDIKSGAGEPNETIRESLSTLIYKIDKKILELNNLENIAIYYNTLFIDKKIPIQPKTFGIIRDSYNINIQNVQDHPVVDTLEYNKFSCWFDSVMIMLFVVYNKFGELILNENNKKSVKYPVIQNLIEKIKSKDEKYHVVSDNINYLVKQCDAISANKPAFSNFCELLKSRSFSQMDSSLKLICYGVGINYDEIPIIALNSGLPDDPIANLDQPDRIVLMNENDPIKIKKFDKYPNFILLEGSRFIGLPKIDVGNPQEVDEGFTLFNVANKNDIKTVEFNNSNYTLRSFIVGSKLRDKPNIVNNDFVHDGHYTTAIVANNKVFHIDAIGPKVTEINKENERQLFNSICSSSTFLYELIQDPVANPVAAVVGGAPGDRFFTFKDFGVSDAEVPDFNNVGLMVLNYGESDEENQAEKIYKLIAALSKEEKYKRIGLTYSANSEQMNNIIDTESSGTEFMKEEDANQGKVLYHLNQRINTNDDKLNRLKIIPFTTMNRDPDRSPPDNKDVGKCVEYACKFAKSKDNLLLVWTNQNYKTEGPAIGGKISKNEIIKNYKKLFVISTQSLYIDDNISGEIYDIQKGIESAGSEKYNDLERSPIIEDFIHDPNFVKDGINFEEGDITCSSKVEENIVDDQRQRTGPSLKVISNTKTNDIVKEMQALFDGDDSLKNILGEYGRPKSNSYRGFINDYRRFIEYSSKDTSIGLLSSKKKPADDDPLGLKIPGILSGAFNDVWTFRHPLDDTSLTKRNMNFFLGISRGTNLALEIFESRPLYDSNMLYQNITDVSNIGNVKYTTTEFEKTLYRCIEYQLKTSDGRNEIDTMISIKIEILKKILNEIKINTDKLQDDVSKTLEKISPIEFDITQDSEIFKGVKLKRNQGKSIDDLRRSDSRFVDSGEPSQKPPSPKPETPREGPRPNKPKVNIQIDSGFRDKK